MRRSVPACVLVAAALAVGAASASAHVQVSPSQAAPDDLVMFTVLVPGETQASTTRVDLKVPKGVLPFSYEATPGWTRRVIQAPDKSVDRIVWTGRLAPDGFARFTFLAATPPEEGTLAWKALQTYSDGEVVRWIGAADSEEPAATTLVSTAVPLQNAGGEGRAAATMTPAAAPADTSGGDDMGAFALALGVGLLGVALGVTAIVLGYRGRRQGLPGGTGGV